MNRAKAITMPGEVFTSYSTVIPIVTAFDNILCLEL